MTIHIKLLSRDTWRDKDVIDGAEALGGEYNTLPDAQPLTVI